MSKIEFDILVDKFSMGIELSIKKMIEQAKLSNDELAIIKDGKVVRVKARDLK